MRPKYKIWDKQENKWFEPTYEAYRGKLQDLMISPSGDITMIELRNGQVVMIHESVFPDRYEIVRNTGAQYEGKDVYEGDLFKIEGNWPVYTVTYDETKATFGLKSSGGTFYPIVTLHARLEVLTKAGNIWDNPELIGE